MDGKQPMVRAAQFPMHGDGVVKGRQSVHAQELHDSCYIMGPGSATLLETEARLEMKPFAHGLGQGLRRWVLEGRSSTAGPRN